MNPLLNAFDRAAQKLRSYDESSGGGLALLFNDRFVPGIEADKRIEMADAVKIIHNTAKAHNPAFWEKWYYAAKENLDEALTMARNNMQEKPAATGHSIDAAMQSLFFDRLAHQLSAPENK